MEQKKTCWTVCLKCNGRGQKRKRISKKALYNYQHKVILFNENREKGKIPIRPKGALADCLHCKGAGVITSDDYPVKNEKQYPHIAIIGAGIGGVALAVACLHRGIPFTLFERDTSFNARSQGYGLTLQQASKAIVGFGILNLKEGIVSTKHLVHTTEGEVIGEWGMRKWTEPTNKKNAKRTNIHIARQSLRLALLNQLEHPNVVKWGHQFIDFKETKGEEISVRFKVNGEEKTIKADLVVGADGIRSSVRNLLIGDKKTPLRYLGCIVILGICSLDVIKNIESSLLDGKTVFQTANGNERIYIMPYDENKVMWQLSFPIKEESAKELSFKGAKYLKEEACKRTQWHSPIPEILQATIEELITGYPVYDRELLDTKLLETGKQITLLGDAAHPMSPFKGQGANQALLDALSLARGVYKGYNEFSNREAKGVRESVLRTFELEMLQRSAVKVKASAEAAKFLHSETVLYKGNQPRGSVLKKIK